LAVVRPGSVDEVAQVLRWCSQSKGAVVPQGGNTGLCGGATPDSSGNAIVLSLTRLNAVRSVDTDNDTMVVEAGCILQAVQQAARDVDRLFPLSLAAEGSCTIGGNLATNAGGTQVLRYGNARDRKSTRLNSSHVKNSYAVFCLKKKKLLRLVNLFIHIFLINIDVMYFYEIDNFIVTGQKNVSLNKMYN